MNTCFRDYKTFLAEFETEVLIHCPQCDRCARSIYIKDKLIWQIACIHCGYSKTSDGKIKRYGIAIDPIFSLSLWLQVPCCGEILWAYNIPHLEFLQQYVQATIREGQGNTRRHYSMAVRLPRWMKLAKNRKSILREIQHLKAQLK